MSTLKETLDALRGLTLSELKSVQSRCVYLVASKHREETREQEVVRLIREHQESTDREDGQEWEQPIGPLNGYLKGARVYKDGERWRSMLNGNVWRPGVAGWRLDPEDGTPPAYRQPTGADPYEKGERITWTDGLIYAATRDGVVHSPAEYAPDWELVEEEAEPEPDPPEDDDEPVDPDEPGDDGDQDDDEPDEEPAELGTIDNPFIWSGDAAKYKAGQYVIHQGVIYRLRSDHRSQSDWPPHVVASVYERLD